MFRPLLVDKYLNSITAISKTHLASQNATALLIFSHLHEKAWKDDFKKPQGSRLGRSTSIKGGSGLSKPTKPVSVIFSDNFNCSKRILTYQTNSRCTNTLKSYIQSCSLEEGRKGDERGWLNQKTNPTKIAWHITIGRLFESQSMYFYLLTNYAVFKTSRRRCKTK